MLASLLLCTAASSAALPHIMMVLVDDLGYGNVGWLRTDGSKEVQTPVMDGLVKEGLELTRFYAFKYCSPSRSAFQSGRNPIHVNVVNPPADMLNPDDPISGYSGIPTKMTSIAEKLSSAGYIAHAVGKWDVGMATPRHTPSGRGYRSWLGYFNHCNDYWTSVDKCGMGSCPGDAEMVDLWEQNGTTSRPGWGLNNSRTQCSQQKQSHGCKFEDDMFAERVVDIISGHNVTAGPLFLFWATHGIHGPLECPDATLDKFVDVVPYKQRRMYAALTNHIDTLIGNAVSALHSAKLYDETLIVLSSDNGGDSSANNWPLRGAKFSNWEGGIHVPAFVSGGAVPESRRGTQWTGIAALWDIYATFCGVAGVDTHDAMAAAAGLPPVDSVNLWPAWSGNDTELYPRAELAIGGALGSSHGGGNKPLTTTVEGIIYHHYKLLWGSFDEAIWTGPQFPNKTSNPSAWTTTANCSAGCLYNLIADPTEHNDIAADNPALVAQLKQRILAINLTAFSPNRGSISPSACSVATGQYRGFWGPFANLTVP
eukprot:Hpha_TRINITY_DN30070_c0_g1::TRINITY_DN30070_c0_g1_i1::g.21442::m.21442/K12375/ARSI_J; arylsulfatase I/J